MFSVFFAWCDSIDVDADCDFSSLQWDESNGGNEQKERWKKINEQQNKRWID